MNRRHATTTTFAAGAVAGAAERSPRGVAHTHPSAVAQPSHPASPAPHMEGNRTTSTTVTRSTTRRISWRLALADRTQRLCQSKLDA
jgi:hypothetical protein